VKRFRITVGEKAYLVEVGDPRQNPVQVTVDGQAFSVNLAPADDEEVISASAPARSPADTRPVERDQPRVTAPMPGTVLDVAVKVGDHVSQGQVLCALEAMKMKSPIRAARGGQVCQVQVHDGQTVSYGELLFVIE
jgi:glutaconyl-CoA/methylmalonyl-CoA decarboxylase subunit gamma